MSYNEPLVFTVNSTTNMTLHRHCLMNAEMVDLHASIYSTAVIVNVFLYTGCGLLLATIIICILSIFLFRKGAHIWNELHSHHSETENISLRYDSPIVEYLRTYNAAFTLGIVFVFLSIPCKLLRFLVLFASNSIDDEFSVSNKILVKAHTHMQTIGLAFELSLYSYKCFVFICTNYRFRCALKYLLRYQRSHVIIDQQMSSNTPTNERQRIHVSHSQESVPFENLYKHLQINDFEIPGHTQRLNGNCPGRLGSYSHRSSFKTRSSVCSRRTKEDEISL